MAAVMPAGVGDERSALCMPIGHRKYFKSFGSIVLAHGRAESRILAVVLVWKDWHSLMKWFQRQS